MPNCVVQVRPDVPKHYYLLAAFQKDAFSRYDLERRAEEYKTKYSNPHDRGSEYAERQNLLFLPAFSFLSLHPTSSAVFFQKVGRRGR
jgi:hypothetical protein